VHTFHVEASEAMYREALGAGGEGHEPVLWHPGLTRYGAAELNERFERRFGRSLDGRGWASWMAVKLLWEAAFRTGSTDAERLAAYLSGEARFDGHKGEPLSFGTRDGQLQQPVYLLRPGDPRPGDGGGSEADGAAVAPDGARLYVGNGHAGTLAVVDARTLQVVAALPEGRLPRGGEVTP
jgi:YVTN family beta-propeller protein